MKHSSLWGDPEIEMLKSLKLQSKDHCPEAITFLTSALDSFKERHLFRSQNMPGTCFGFSALPRPNSRALGGHPNRSLER